MFMAKMHFIGPAIFIKNVAEAIVDGGAIVNISSLSAYDPLSGIVGYAASKRAGDRVVQGAALEYRHKRLRINGIIPSLVPTELSRQGMRNFGADPEAFEHSFVELTPLGRITRPKTSPHSRTCWSAMSSSKPVRSCTTAAATPCSATRDFWHRGAGGCS